MKLTKTKGRFSFKQKMLNFKEALGQEKDETIEMLGIYGKFTTRQASKTEMKIAHTQFFDLLKGTLPVYLAYFLGYSPIEIGLIGIATCLGHIYPPYFQFKGGKAVATGLGTLLPLGMDMTGLLIVTWLLTVAVSGYSSLAAIVTAIAAPIYVEQIKPEYTTPVIMLSVLIVLRHISNIRRLITGKEQKIVNWKQ